MRFRCHAGHNPRISALTFLKSGCPSCRGAETRKVQKNWLADTLPEMASQWHPTRNGKLTPQDVVWDSQRTVWWRADCCGHEWQATPRDRDKYTRLRCPKCRTILGSLAWQDPGLAAEWSPANPLTAWDVRTHALTPFIPQWICATNTAHVWQSSLSGRSNGSECPECKVAGKSKVELAHHAAAEEVFTGVRSGAVLRDTAFATLLPVQFLVDLAGPVDTVVPLMDVMDLLGQLPVLDASGGLGPGTVGVVRARGDLQCLADRLDPVFIAVLVHEGAHHLDGRSSSAAIDKPRPASGSCSPGAARGPHARVQ
ncbi:hypothetical protein E5206_12715 [Arthrobacter sp. PAMC25564]|nr:hypothetical protein E5206_12715 [Arthrobacter sp. PAMC25564]